WLRAHAAKLGMSVSRFAGQVLQERMHEVRDYDEAMRRFLALRAFAFEFVGGRRPTREDLHDRADLR
ncbi:MAG TPA: hypothetical protein VJQ47_03995, partial [Steroidobacteraceae bacterium]|nr:hypothetical protein [Steroidobacteraceae bacterium]